MADEYKYRVIDQDDDLIVVEFDKLALKDINQLRVAFYRQLEVVRLSYFHIRKHHSNYADGFLCDRLGLLALRHLDPIEKYTTRGVPTRTSPPSEIPGVRMELKVEGPAVIYARDLKLINEPSPESAEAEGVNQILGLEVIYPDTPILNLYDGQYVDIVAYGVRGTHWQNAAWCAGNCTFYTAEPESDPKIHFAVEAYGQYSPKEIIDLLIAKVTAPPPVVVEEKAEKAGKKTSPKRRVSKGKK